MSQRTVDTFRVGTIRAQLYTRDNRAGLWVCWCRHGKRYRRALGTPSPKLARTRARELIETQTPMRGAAGSLMLEDAVALVIAQRWPDGSEPSRTKADHSKRLANFVAWAGSVNLAALSRQEMSVKVAQYIAHRGKTLSARSLINDRRVISRLCSWLMQHQHVTHWQANPASALFVVCPKPVAEPKHVATAAEVEQVLASVTGPLRAMVVLVLSGLRPAGCFRLAWSDIDTEAGIVTAREKGRVRTVKLSAWAAGELAALRGTGPVWKLKQITFFSHLQALAWRLNLKGKLSAYALRRAVVARLWSQGVPTATAAAMLGHSVQVAERHYKALDAVGQAAELLNWQTAPKSATTSEQS
jgi:integrase